MTQKVNTGGLLAHLHRQQQEVEAAQHDDEEQQDLDRGVPERPVADLPTPAPAPPPPAPAEPVQPSYDGDVVPSWLAPLAGSLFEDPRGEDARGPLFPDPRGPGATGSLFTPPPTDEEFF